MVTNMKIDKFYVIKNNIVENIIVCSEDYAIQNNLIKFPVSTEFGKADINWTFIDNKFLPPPRDILFEWSQIRNKRDQLLSQSDLAVLPDRWMSYTPEQQKAWSDYRMELREVPQKFVDPREVVFPTPPESI